MSAEPVCVQVSSWIPGLTYDDCAAELDMRGQMPRWRLDDDVIQIGVTVPENHVASTRQHLLSIVEALEGRAWRDHPEMRDRVEGLNAWRRRKR